MWTHPFLNFDTVRRFINDGEQVNCGLPVFTEFYSLLAWLRVMFASGVVLPFVIRF